MSATISPFFGDKIQQAIIDRLKNAERSIQVAVCWFNDVEIFNELYKRMVEKDALCVEVVISDDCLNRHPNGCDFQKLIDHNAKLYLSDPKHLMHNKYCIIDGEVLITGSYNWTNGARHNQENIVVIENDADCIGEYERDFVGLKGLQNAVSKFRLLSEEEFKECFPEKSVYWLYYEEIETLSISSVSLTPILSSLLGISKVSNSMKIENSEMKQSHASPEKAHFQPTMRRQRQPYALGGSRLFYSSETLYLDIMGCRFAIVGPDVPMISDTCLEFEGLNCYPQTESGIAIFSENLRQADRKFHYALEYLTSAEQFILCLEVGFYGHIQLKGELYIKSKKVPEIRRLSVHDFIRQKSL